LLLAVVVVELAQEDLADQVDLKGISDLAELAELLD
jgi:hypothetical protein